MSVSVFDILIVIPLLWATYRGFMKGLIIELASFVALAFGVYGAIGFSEFTNNILKENLGINSEYNSLIAFAVTFIVIVAAVFFLAKLLENVVKMAALSAVNKISGSIFSVLKFALIISAIIYLVNSFDQKQIVFNKTLKEKSFLYKPLQVIAPTLFPSLKNLVEDNPVDNFINVTKTELKQLNEK
jgi:membrane protein required for colicin V production